MSRIAWAPKNRAPLLPEAPTTTCKHSTQCTKLAALLIGLALHLRSLPLFLSRVHIIIAKWRNANTGALLKEKGWTNRASCLGLQVGLVCKRSQQCISQGSCGAMLPLHPGAKGLWASTNGRSMPQHTVILMVFRS